ncbi:MurR/RpiR family transcriptional regulator [Turicibacter bilis]|uniref:MurR/RpiR family transcriptional regulator n=1 Tax=Turicibacter bilis TaxID=2735723 RepID=A0A9Q9FEI9_9FIRM|nr:MurR/RpiR family transcriptional regulator [Turicibacter bilis]MBS3196878.1 MurR/RpiR family transcriptional regulator [Turicibacter bilis]MBS3201641.1 MurR/RpiR family transcriptional regulator [Turicibacter bilis]UUF07176.1 MurR/RpiR family transcriptional regulator [Turicibacter bilis]UUF08398.1 MurR/RpiR family transcriptional regulator [Turicibacter bilis]
MKIINELNELKRMNKLTSTEQGIVNYILTYPEELEKISSRQLAELTYTSPATVVRICQKLGFSGYSEFKIKYLQEVYQTPRMDQINRTNPITSEDSLHRIVNKVAALEITAIEQTKKGIDLDQLNRVSELLNQATCIDFYAFDNNLHLAKNACSHFLYAGKQAVIHDSSNAQFMQAFASVEGHVAIIISRTGENPMLYRIANVLRERKIPLLVLTESRHSSLAKISTEHLYLYNVHRFTDMGTILFQTSVQYLFDLLFAILFSRNFENSVKQNEMYEEINEYHQFYKEPQKL